MKDKKLYNKPEDIQIDNKLKSFLNKNAYKKNKQKYVIVNYIKSNNIYNEIYEYLVSIERNKIEIEKKNHFILICILIKY